MKPVLTDRLAVVLIVAAVAVWVVCLGVLWGWTFDASGTFSLGVWLLGLGWGWRSLRRRGVLINRARRLLRWCRLDPWEPLEDALAGRLGSSREDAASRMRVLSVMAGAAGVCMVVSVMWIGLCGLGVTLLGMGFLLGGLEWRVVELLCLLVGAWPVGRAVAAVWFGAMVVRASGGRDVYAGALRDVLTGVAVGMVGMAVAWWFGANLVYLVFALAGGVVLVGLVAVSRGELSTHPRKALLPFGPPERFARLGIAAGTAGLLGVLWVQNRLLADVLGVSQTRRLLWAGLSVGLLVFFMARQDRKGRVPGRMQQAGAYLGLAAGLGVQAAELLLCLSLDRGAGVVAALAVAGQVPLAAQAAVVLCGQRRAFATSGGSAGAYGEAAMGGLAAGAAGVLLAGWIGGGWVLLVGAAGGLMLAGAVIGYRHVGKLSRRVQWAAWSAVLGGSIAWGVAATAGAAAGGDDLVRPGVWLTVEGRYHPWRKRYVQTDVFPREAYRRSEAITECVGELLRLRKGRWWLVASAAGDLPDPETAPPEVYNRVVLVGASPQPTSPGVRVRKRWPPLSHSQRDYFRTARRNNLAELGSDFYDVVFLAPLPADHPQAWRCYHERLLRRCATLVETRRWEVQEEVRVVTTRYGVLGLRTQAGRGSVRRALGVARTFHEAVGSGWAVAAVQRGGLDLLLLGPAGSVEEQRGEGGAVLLEDLLEPLRTLAARRSGVFVVPIEALWEAYPDVRPIRLASPPPARLADTPTLRGLENFLQTKKTLSELRRAQPTPQDTDTP